jgi:hypothetical protein
MQGESGELSETIKMKTYNGLHVPEHIAAGLLRYVEEGCPVGGFLTAVLCNDLREAVGRADDKSMAGLPAIVGWLYNETPAGCWGSPDKVKAWVLHFQAEREAKRIQESIVSGIGPEAIAAADRRRKTDPPDVNMVDLAHSFFVKPYLKK